MMRKNKPANGNYSLKDEVMTYYTAYFDPNATGPYCRCCKEKVIELLVIDHMKKRTKKDNKSGKDFYEYLKENDFPEGYQVLCFSCNFGKKLYGKCPHTEKMIMFNFDPNPVMKS